MTGYNSLLFATLSESRIMQLNKCLKMCISDVIMNITMMIIKKIGNTLHFNH